MKMLLLPLFNSLTTHQQNLEVNYMKKQQIKF